jgi:hypothetical protein
VPFVVNSSGQATWGNYSSYYGTRPSAGGPGGGSPRRATATRRSQSRIAPMSAGITSALTSGWIGKRSARDFNKMGSLLYDAATGTKTTQFAAQSLVRNARFLAGPAGSNTGATIQPAATYWNRNAPMVKAYGRGGMTQDARMAALGRAEKHMWRGLKRLPIKTKVGLPLAVAGAWGWMHRSKRDNFYTHYYDF